MKYFILILAILISNFCLAANSFTSSSGVNKENFHSFPRQKKNNILILKENQNHFYQFPGNYIYNDSTQWTDQLEKKIRKELSFFQVYTLEIDETVSSSALKQSAKIIEEQNPKIVVIALGENDGLYSKKIEDIKLYLSTIIQTAKKNHAQVILVGGRLPEYYGTAYINEFADIYAKLAKKHDITYVPEDKFTFTYPLFVNQYENPLEIHTRETLENPEVKKIWQAVEKFVEEEKKQQEKSVYYYDFYRFPQLSGQ